jgi:OmpA-OmpF porin, OOP family
MPSSSGPRALGCAAVLFAAGTSAAPAAAQQQARGFAVERFYPSAPGGGWFVMDDLDLYGGLQGALALTAGYAKKPLLIPDGARRLAVVSDQAFTDFGLAVGYDRFRLYLDLDAPLVAGGESGTVGGYEYTAPSFTLATRPDLLSDARVGLDARLFGAPGSPLRLGAGAQLFIPNGDRSDYDTDGTYRAMLRALVAGDLGIFTYAGQLGVHLRPLDDAPTPGSPRGSELLFGIAAGARLPLGHKGGTALVLGPEIYGETAFSSFLSAPATGLEWLMTGRLEGTGGDGPQLRVKLGTGGGINRQFGAPEWRGVFSVEVFDHSTDRDKDGVTDSKDACPDTPGVKTGDPKTNGCPPAPAVAVPPSPGPR